MGKDRVGTSFKPDKTFFQKLIYYSSNIENSDAIDHSYFTFVLFYIRSVIGLFDL